MIRNKQGYTILELIIAIAIFASMLLSFFYVIRETILFVSVRKQEVSSLTNVTLIRSKIQEIFAQDRPKVLLRNINVFLTGALASIKDSFLESSHPHTLDALVVQYTPIIESGSINPSQTELVAFGIVDKITHKLIPEISSDN